MTASPSIGGYPFLCESLRSRRISGIGLRYLKADKAEHGDCRVPVRFRTEDDLKLGGWGSSRRGDIPAGRPTQDRIDALNADGFA